MKAEDDPGWSSYSDIILQLRRDRSLVIDLRRPITTAQQAVLEATGLGKQFAIVTAHNPRGQPASAHQNEVLEGQLQQSIATTGVKWVHADGVSPDGRHRESGVAVRMPCRRAREIAREFNQSALFWYSHGAMWLVGALVNVKSVRLPR